MIQKHLKSGVFEGVGRSNVGGLDEILPKVINYVARLVLHDPF